MNRRRALYAALSVLALVLVGTVLVLSSVTYYLSIAPAAYLNEQEVPWLPDGAPSNVSRPERIPRIIHQTWKSDELPPRWKAISQACKDMMPDYEYKLWTDATSREFIANHYPWFLETFDGYTYTIQRADAIRYFVLHHYGGIYMDLDIGCLRRMDPLLAYPVILPKTIPVGVSNDLIFSEKAHPFMEQTIHNLVTFDHSWVLNYPTVMFSTGPMFLSAQYGIYTSSHPNTYLDEIRILPKSLYGKNAKDGEAPHSFFSHFYGSSWHADDAAFIGFLGTWGKLLMWIGLAVLVFGLFKLSGTKQRRFRRMEIVFPRLSHHSGRWHLRWSSTPSSPDGPGSPMDEAVPVLHLPYPPSPSPSTMSDVSTGDPYAGRTESPIVQAFNHIRNRVATFTGVNVQEPRSPVRPRRQRRSRGVLFFLPAIFTQPSDIELSSVSLPSRLPGTISRASQLPPEKAQYQDDLESMGDLREESSSLALSSRPGRDSQPHRNTSRSRSRSATRPLLSSWDS